MATEHKFLKTILVVASCWLLGISNTHARKFKGIIIFENDTINVTFKIRTKSYISDKPVFYSLQKKVHYVNKSGVTRDLLPHEAKEFRFQSGDEVIRMISVPNMLKLTGRYDQSPNIFLKLEVDGRLKLFKYFDLGLFQSFSNSSLGVSEGGNYLSTEEFVIQNENNNLSWLRSDSFKHLMKHYFEDCPKLMSKINNHSFGSQDLRAIITYYNSKCD